MTKIIGKVSATENNPSTIDEFYFWTDKKQILSPFDIVKVCHEGDSITYGVVEEINHITDAPSHFTSYISSDFGDTSDNIGNMNRLGMNYIKARVSCNTKNIYTPVLNGRQVSLCNEDDIKTALGLNEKEVKNPLASGYLQMYNGDSTIKVKVVLNANFILGPDGAHINISKYIWPCCKDKLLNVSTKSHPGEICSGAKSVCSFCILQCKRKRSDGH